MHKCRFWTKRFAAPSLCTRTRTNTETHTNTHTHTHTHTHIHNRLACTGVVLDQFFRCTVLMHTHTQKHTHTHTTVLCCLWPAMTRARVTLHITHHALHAQCATHASDHSWSISAL